jgi:hypothetical protein
MATYKTSNYGQTPVADRAGEHLRPRFSWPVRKNGDESHALANGDKIVVGQLPAGHRFDKLNTQVVVDNGTTALNYDLCIDNDATIIIDNQAVSATTFTRTAASISDANAEAIGVSTANRDVYLILNTAPTADGGNVYVDLSYIAANAG